MYFVCFNGPPRSGKDTLARMLAEHMDSQSVAVPVVEISLSTPLRRIAYQMVGQIYGPHTDTYEEFKETHYPQFGCNGRQLMIDVSEKFLKPCYGQSTLGQMALAELAELPPYPFDGVVLVRDSGFQVEVKTLVDAVGPRNVFVVQLKREGCTFEGDSREWVTHALMGTAENNGTLEQLREDAKGIYDGLVNVLGWKL